VTEFLCSQEIVAAARRNLSKEVWDYLVGAAESETTLRRNRYALDSYAFVPRVLRDVSKVDSSTTALGHKLRIPVFLAPMGSMQLLTEDGAVAAGRAAGRFGIMHMVSSVSRHEIEDVAAAGEAPKVFQLYIRGDMDWVRAYLERARNAGCVAFTLTVDAAYYGIRERQLMNRWERPGFRDRDTRMILATVTWDMMRAIRDLWRGPMILKGIASAADARLAVDHGVDVVYVSNHGGRELDHNRGTLDMLPEIVDAVGGRAEVWIDGGFTRATDVIKALCLGARAIGIGRLQGWGLAAAGEDGLVRVLEILEEEMVNAMGLIGVTRVADLGPDYLARVTPLGPTHETSAFRHLGPEPLR
jgi:glycolate oxidase